MRAAPTGFSTALAAAGVRARRQLDYEWWGSAFHEAAKRRVRARELVATPRDFRPADRDRGLDLLEGRFVLAGAVLDVGPDGDPWDRASPSRRFAEDLHRFRWMRDLLMAGEPGAREALRLTLGWERAFGRWSLFSWGGDQLAPRVYALACAVRRLSAVAVDDLERRALFTALARQADHLSRLNEGPARAAERNCAAAIGALGLGGGAVERVGARALQRLARALDVTVLADGGHRSRSPEAGLQLLLDLLTLDDLLLQRGREAPKAVSRAIDRLSAAVRFFTLGDGRLACFQGGEAVDLHTVSASQVHDDAAAPKPFGFAPHSRYQRLAGLRLQALVDAGAPAAGAWSAAACAQPAAIDVSGDGDRLITNSGWSLDAPSPDGRLTDGGSTLTVNEAPSATPIRGWPARVLGARLKGLAKADVRRNETGGGVWISVGHDAWSSRFGLRHERRLYLDIGGDELRGEERLSAAGKGPPHPYAARFHLHPDVRASIARDGRSVLLVGPSERGWWFRNDSPDVRLEPSTHYVGGVPRRGVQIVLRGEARPPGGARLRWKLSPAEFPEGVGPPPAPAPEGVAA